MKGLNKQYDIVCLVTNDISTDRRMIRTCSTLSTYGWSVLLIGRLLVDSKDLPIYSFDTQRVQCHSQEGPFFYLEVLWRFRQALSSLRYKKLLCTDLDSLGIVNVMNTSAAEVYFDAHEYFTEVPELTNSVFKKWIWSTWGKKAMRKVSKAYTVGPELSKILGAKYQFHFDIVRNVPKTSNETQTITEKNKLLSLIYLGVLNPGRGLEELIEVVNKKDDVKLTIVGDGPLESLLIEKAKPNSRICFLGKQPPDKLTALLSKADVGVNLLESTSQSYYYSLANKFFDYIHAGLPVLCMNYPEYLNINSQFDCMYPVKKLTIDSIMNALSKIDKSSAVWIKKKEETRKASKAYNWDTESENLLDVIASK